MPPLDVQTCFALIVSAHAVSVLLHTAEFLSIHRVLLPKQELEIDFATAERNRRARRWMRRFDSGSVIFGLLVLRGGAAALASWMLWTKGPAWLALAPLTLLTAWRNLRFANIANGSWIAEMLVFGPTLVWSLSPGNDLLGAICLAAIAAHVCIAYLGAGLAKVSASGWRNGESLSWTLNHGPFAVPFGRALAERPNITAALAWAVIALELGFVLSLISGPKVCMAILAAGACFHLANSILLGVHWFLWTFVGAYPAIWFTMRFIWDALRSS